MNILKWYVESVYLEQQKTDRKMNYMNTTINGTLTFTLSFALLIKKKTTAPRRALKLTPNDKHLTFIRRSRYISNLVLCVLEICDDATLSMLMLKFNRKCNGSIIIELKKKKRDAHRHNCNVNPIKSSLTVQNDVGHMYKLERNVQKMLQKKSTMSMSTGSTSDTFLISTYVFVRRIQSLWKNIFTHL